MKKVIDDTELCAALQMPRVCLRTGVWKNMFEEEECLQLISVALNSCTLNQLKKNDSFFSLRIAGYLITPKKLYLVLDMKPDEVLPMLTIFFEILLEMIRNKKRAQESAADAAAVISMSILQSHQLFVKDTFYNDALVQLLTGVPYSRRYYNPQFARLKDFLHHHVFCSVMDYAGAEGPVRVDTVWACIKEKIIANKVKGKIK